SLGMLQIMAIAPKKVNQLPIDKPSRHHLHSPGVKAGKRSQVQLEQYAPVGEILDALEVILQIQVPFRVGQNRPIPPGGNGEYEFIEGQRLAEEIRLKYQVAVDERERGATRFK